MLKGTISPEQLEELKDLYKPLYRYTVGNEKKGLHDIIYRTISKPVYDKIIELGHLARNSNSPPPLQEVDELIFSECVLFPILTQKEKDNLPIGIIPSVSKAIQENSYFIGITAAGTIIGPDTISRNIKEYDHWGEPSPDKIEEIKKDNPVYELYRVRIGHYVFIMRPIVKNDAILAISSNDSSFSVVQSTVVYPKQGVDNFDWNTVPSGIISKLYDTATHISDWEEIPAEVEEI